VNDIEIQGYLVFHIVPDLQTTGSLFSIQDASNQRLLMAGAKKCVSLMKGLSKLLFEFYFVWYMTGL